MKKKKALFGWPCLIIGLIVVALFACSPSTNSPAPIGVIDDVKIEGIDLTSLIPLPVVGETRPTTLDHEKFSGTFAWQNKNSSDQYVNSTGNMFFAFIYKAELTLTAKDGYTFKGTTENSFTHTTASSCLNPEGNSATLTVTIVFPKAASNTDATVSETDLTSAFPAPYRSGVPATEFENAQYHAGITWETAAGQAFNDNTFGAGTAYRALVKITVYDGFKIGGLTANSFSYTGATSVAFNVSTLTVSILFPATAAEGVDQVVTQFNLTEIIDVPVHRATPSVAITPTDQYTGAIAWSYADDTAVGGTFADGKGIKAVVTFTPKTGFTFTGVPGNVFSHNGAESTAYTAGSTTVTVSFTAPAWKIGAISYPVLGNTGWNVGVQSCCWPVDGNNNRSGTVLISSTDPSAVASKTGNTQYWDYAWQGGSSTTNENRSSWKFFVGPTGTEDTTNSLVFNRGWKGGILNGDESGGGHGKVLLDNLNDAQIPEKFRKRGHVYSFDLGQVRNVATFGMYPRTNTNTNKLSDSSTTDKWPILFEVLYSESPMGPIPDESAVSLGLFNFAIFNVGDTGAWRDASLYLQTPDGRPVSARYLQVRIYAEQRNGEGASWICPSFHQIRFGVSD